MRYELRLHRVTFGILAVVLMAFVAFLFYIRPSLADERLEVIASLAIVIVAAAAFVAMGMIEGIMVFYFGKQHKREVLCYLLLGLLSLVSGLYLSISETTSLQTVSLWQRLMLCCSVWQNCASLSTWSVTLVTEGRYLGVASLRSLLSLYSSAGQSLRRKEPRPCWSMSPSFPSCNYFHFFSTLALPCPGRQA